ncbi:MAG TPA: TIGR00269 family protein [Candidatus Nanoarchaeia archaeon]|nr:TIGR00269 family protein [Candidatus Nanoarchaeia archaeon]
MVCKKCVVEPVMRLPNSNVSLCKQCFFKYFERKVFKTIKEYKLVEENDHVGVACSGGKDSTTILYLIKKFAKTKKNVKVSALAVDEGIKGYRDKSLEFLKGLCEKEKIPLHIFRYKDAFGRELDEIVKEFPRPCSICGVFRRYVLNKGARLLKVSKLATGHNLDDEAQSILMNQFRRNVKVSARLGPKTGVVRNERFVPRVKPLYLLTEKETASYAFLKGFMDEFKECPYARGAYRNHVREVLSSLEERFPGTKHNVVLSFLEVLPLLKGNERYSGSIKECEVCGEPCSQDICQACFYVESVVKKI